MSEHVHAGERRWPAGERSAEGSLVSLLAHFNSARMVHLKQGWANFLTGGATMGSET